MVTEKKYKHTSSKQSLDGRNARLNATADVEFDLPASTLVPEPRIESCEHQVLLGSAL